MPEYSSNESFFLLFLSQWSDDDKVMLGRLYLSRISFINFSANSTELSIFFLSYTELRLNFLFYSHGTECQKSHTLENPKIIRLWNVTSGFRYVFFPLWRLRFKLLSMPITKRRRRGWSCWEEQAEASSHLCFPPSFQDPSSSTLTKQARKSCTPTTNTAGTCGKEPGNCLWFLFLRVGVQAALYHLCQQTGCASG